MKVREILKILIPHYTNAIEEYKRTKDYDVIIHLDVERGICWAAYNKCDVSKIYTSNFIKVYGRKICNNQRDYLFPLPWPNESFEYNITTLTSRLEFMENALKGIGSPNLEEEII